MKAKRTILFFLLLSALIPQAWAADFGEDDQYLGQVVDDYEDDSNIAAMIDTINNQTLDCMELSEAVGNAYENFSTWVEFEEAGDRITFISDYQVHLNVIRNVDSRIYKDFGMSYFNVFDDYLIDFQFDSTTWNVNGKVWLFLSNGTANPYAQYLAGNNLLAFIMSQDTGPVYKVIIAEYEGVAGGSTSSTTSFNGDTWYYARIILNATHFSAFIYSDEARTILIEEVSKTLIKGKDDYRYFLISSLDTNSAINSDAYIKNVYLGSQQVGYSASGSYYVEDVLNGDPAIAILYNLTIPSGANATMEFSPDNATWTDHNGNPGCDILVEGYEALDLRDIYNVTLHRRVNFTEGGGDTPRMYQARLVTVTTVAAGGLFPGLAIGIAILIIAYAYSETRG